MQLRVLYFAVLRDLVEREEESVDAPPCNVREFIAWIAEHRPALRGRMGSVRIARNEVFAYDDEALCDGDVVALIPPVAGG
jgi:molybdopterin converting factor subunit 1